MPKHKTEAKSEAIVRLEATIAKRRTADPRKSYVARINARGRGKMACKLGEEATEVVVAALTESREALIGEAADLMFHLLMILGDREVTFAEVVAELESREGISGLSEKAARKG